MGKGRTVANGLEETFPNSLVTEESAPPRPLDGMMAEERRTQILQIVRTEGRGACK